MARRSMRCVEFRKPFQLMKEEVPTAPKGGAVVKNVFAGICHTDVHSADDEFPGIPPKTVLGHEMAGTVVDIDPSSEHKVGDRVAVYWHAGCRNCTRCDAGETTACIKDVKHWAGINEDGGFSDYVVIADHRQLVKVPDAVAMDVACLLPCSGITAYNGVCTLVPTVQDFVKHTNDCAVLVVGAGGLGLWGVQFCKQLLPAGVRVISADVDDEKLSAARDAGCDEAVVWGKDMSEDDIVAATKKVCGSLGGVVAAVDFVNVPATFERVEKVLVQGGMHVVVGLLGGNAPASVPLMPYVLLRHHTSGVLMGSLQQLKDLFALMAKGNVKPPPITHHPLENVYDVMQDLKAGKVKGRAVIKL